MNLEDFERLVATPNCVIQYNTAGSRRQNNNFDVANVLIDALAKCNLLSTSVVIQNGAYNCGNLPRSGIVMSKVDTDMMADEEHYVYRAVFQLGEGRQSLNPREENVTTRDSAIIRLTQLSMARRPDGVPLAIEMTQYGKMSDLAVPPSNIREDQFRINYSVSWNNVSGFIPSPFVANRRASEYTLMSINGVEGKITFKVMEDILNVTPLTEEDITIARGFINEEQLYTGWIPNDAMKDEPIISANLFSVYRLGDTDRSIRATTVKEKTKDRRTYFNTTTQLKSNDKRYTIHMGEYFFWPSSSFFELWPADRNWSMFEYDTWLSELSDGITMSKTNSRVGFLSAFTEHEESKSINVKTKSLGSADDGEIESTFTRRANTGRFN